MRNATTTTKTPTKTPYVVAIVSITLPWEETGRTRYADHEEAATAVAEILSDKRDFGRALNAQMADEAVSALDVLERWRGEPTKLLVGFTAIYMLPQPPWPATGPEMTWQDFETSRERRRALAGHKGVVRSMVLNIETSAVRVKDPEGFARGLIERGITLTDLAHALRLGGRDGAEYLSKCMREVAGRTAQRHR